MADLLNRPYLAYTGKVYVVAYCLNSDCWDQECLISVVQLIHKTVTYLLGWHSYNLSDPETAPKNGGDDSHLVLLLCNVSAIIKQSTAF